MNQRPTEPRALVVLPTYNEVLNLEKVTRGIRGAGYDVLVVDDGSPDGTGDLADRLAAADDGLSVIHRSGKLGLGSAYVAGFTAGLANGYDVLVEMDADGSHLLEHLDAIVAASRGSRGLAIGSRWIPGGSVVGWGPARLILSRVANVYVRAMLGIPTRDATSGFRAYTADLLRRIDLARVLSNGYSFQVEMVYRAFNLGFPIVEVPIRFEDRVAGRSKVSQGEILKALWSVVRIRLRGVETA